MPTFNKNKDSLAADINGTYEGTDPDDNVHYDDYHAYTPGEQKTDDAVYDNDDNTTDEGESAVNPDNITTKEETHTAASTLNATVMTMQAWIDAGAKPGPYWVYDVDGWAYWAQAIQPGTSTGLLLDGIQLVTEPDDNWYYGINVVGQFATMGNWGSAEGSDGFFGDNAGPAPTDNALFLLNQAAGLNTSDFCYCRRQRNCCAARRHPAIQRKGHGRRRCPPQSGGYMVGSRSDFWRYLNQRHRAAYGRCR